MEMIKPRRLSLKEQQREALRKAAIAYEKQVAKDSFVLQAYSTAKTH